MSAARSVSNNHRHLPPAQLVIRRRLLGCSGPRRGTAPIFADLDLRSRCEALCTPNDDTVSRIDVADNLDKVSRAQSGKNTNLFRH